MRREQIYGDKMIITTVSIRKSLYSPYGFDSVRVTVVPFTFMVALVGKLALSVSS